MRNGLHLEVESCGSGLQRIRQAAWALRLPEQVVRHQGVRVRLLPSSPVWQLICGLLLLIIARRAFLSLLTSQSRQLQACNLQISILGLRKVPASLDCYAHTQRCATTQVTLMSQYTVRRRVEPSDA